LQHILLDWLSFTVDGDGCGGETIEAYGKAVWTRLAAVLGRHARTVIADRAFHWSGGRAPYLYSLRRIDNGVVIFFDRRRKEILIEMSGTGCQTARVLGGLEELACDFAESVTRLDATVDLETSTTPAEFVGAGFSKRFKSGGQQFSESGQTFYVGAWKSNRFARVYRYNPPHPRAAFLRVEHVFRDESATAAVRFLDDNGLEGLLAACGQIFQWSHEAWILADLAAADVLESARDPKASRDTVFWVYRSVVPAVARLLLEHRLSWGEFEEEVKKAVSRLETVEEPITPSTSE